VPLTNAERQRRFKKKLTEFGKGDPRHVSERIRAWIDDGIRSAAELEAGGIAEWASPSVESIKGRLAAGKNPAGDLHGVLVAALKNHQATEAQRLRLARAEEVVRAVLLLPSQWQDEEVQEQP